MTPSVHHNWHLAVFSRTSRCGRLTLNCEYRPNYTSTSISVFKTFAISQHYFHCMATSKPTAITTDQKDSDSSVISNVSFHTRASMLYLVLPNRSCLVQSSTTGSRWSINKKISALFNYVYALSPWRSRSEIAIIEGCYF